MLTNCCFIGIEAEGRNRGRKTLFVAEEGASPAKILSILKKNPDIKHVYFGAGGLRYIPRHQIKMLPRLKEDKVQVTIEISSPTFLKDVPFLPNIAIVLSFSTKGVTHLRMRNVKIKVEDYKELLVFDCCDVYPTSLSDNLYRKDVKVDP